jgi:hypothetical protein
MRLTFPGPPHLQRDFQNMIDINPDCDEEAKEALSKVQEELYGRG